MNNIKTFTKLADGEVGYIKNNRRQLGPNSAGIVELFLDIGGRKPHVKIWLPDQSDSGWLDYDAVGYGGPPPVDYEAFALVLWTRNGQTMETPPQEESHMAWSTEKISENWLESELDGFKIGLHWVLCRDPWAGNLHWLSCGFEQEITIADGTSHKVTLENIGANNVLPLRKI